MVSQKSRMFYKAVLSCSFIVSSFASYADKEEFSEFGFEDVEEKNEVAQTTDALTLTELNDENIWNELYRNERAKRLKMKIMYFYNSAKSEVYEKDIKELNKLKRHPDFNKIFAIFLVNCNPTDESTSAATLNIRTKHFMPTTVNAQSNPVIAIARTVPNTAPNPTSTFLWSTVKTAAAGSISANQMIEAMELPPLPAPVVTLTSSTICELEGHEYEALLNSPKPIFLQFGAHWCGPCQDLKRKFEEVVYSSAYDKDYFVVFLDHDRSCKPGLVDPATQELFNQIFNKENNDLEIPTSLPVLILIKPGKHRKGKFKLLNRDEAVEAARKPKASDGKFPFFDWLHRLDKRND